ncbi:MAG: hypothetical protein QOC99_2677 [Acidobacteriota bacterium]|nr:hypothetical protein [Acidobacteriota bacterium]
MTREMSLRAVRGATTPASEELRRQLLALVLAAVLVWYTFVVPAHATAWSSIGATPDDEGLGGQVRGLDGAAQIEKDEAKSVEELDWPEFIYP